MNFSTLASAAEPSLGNLTARVNTTARLSTPVITFSSGGSNGTVLVSNIAAGRSVIHVIDAVLIPAEGNVHATLTELESEGFAAGSITSEGVDQ